MLGMFEKDFQKMIDSTVKISVKRGEPPVDFSYIDRILYTS